MIVKFVYNGVEYLTERAVREAIYEKDKVFFSKSPSENKAQFWEKFGVTYTEEDEPLANPPREPDLAELKQMKLGALDGAFSEYRNSGKTFLVSSLGFKANANVTAFDNVSGLVAQLQYKTDKGEENPQVGFMTFDDELVMLGLGDLKTLQVEISENGSNGYAQKWMLRQTIQAAENEEVLNAIEIKFVHTDFTAEA